MIVPRRVYSPSIFLGWVIYFGAIHISYDSPFFCSLEKVTSGIRRGIIGETEIIVPSLWELIGGS